MKIRLPITVSKAGNNYCAYSDFSPGAFSTGETAEEAVARLESIAGNQIRELIDSGKACIAEFGDDNVFSVVIGETEIPDVADDNPEAKKNPQTS